MNRRDRAVQRCSDVGILAAVAAMTLAAFRFPRTSAAFALISIAALVILSVISLRSARR